jgi:hypothetical protein
MYYNVERNQLSKMKAAKSWPRCRSRRAHVARGPPGFREQQRRALQNQSKVRNRMAPTVIQLRERKCAMSYWKWCKSQARLLVQTPVRTPLVRSQGSQWKLRMLVSVCHHLTGPDYCMRASRSGSIIPSVSPRNPSMGKRVTSNLRYTSLRTMGHANLCFPPSLEN